MSPGAPLWPGQSSWKIKPNSNTNPRPLLGRGRPVGWTRGTGAPWGLGTTQLAPPPHGRGRYLGPFRGEPRGQSPGACWPPGHSQGLGESRDCPVTSRSLPGPAPVVPAFCPSAPAPVQPGTPRVGSAPGSTHLQQPAGGDLPRANGPPRASVYRDRARTEGVWGGGKETERWANSASSQPSSPSVQTSRPLSPPSAASAKHSRAAPSSSWRCWPALRSHPALVCT